MYVNISAWRQNWLCELMTTSKRTYFCEIPATLGFVMIFTYRTDSSNFLAMPLRLYDFSTHIRLIPHFAGSGSVLQHHGCELSLGLTGDVD